DVVARRGLVERLPQILVAHGLAVRGPPPVSLPALKPLGDASLHVGGIGVQPHPAWPLQGLERLDRSGQFHAVVGGGVLGARRLPAVPAGAQHRAPAARPGIAPAGAVGTNLHHCATRHWRRTSTGRWTRRAAPCARRGLRRALRTSGTTGIMRMVSSWAWIRYTAPSIGHQRSPAFSRKASRSNRAARFTGGRYMIILPPRTR